jgi:hypothetical protein
MNALNIQQFVAIKNVSIFEEVIDVSKGVCRDLNVTIMDTAKVSTT